jgi:hypothetical protein
MYSIFSQTKKLISSFLIIAIFQMVISPIFINQAYAAAGISFTDDVAS